MSVIWRTPGRVGGFDHLLTALALHTLMPRLAPDAALHVLRAWGVDVLVSHTQTRR